MRVSVRRTGGFAGLTDDLGSAQVPPGSDLAQLIQSLRSDRISDHIGADLFRYEITVENGGSNEVWIIQDNEPPENQHLRALISVLEPECAG